MILLTKSNHSLQLKKIHNRVPRLMALLQSNSFKVESYHLFFLSKMQGRYTSGSQPILSISQIEVNVIWSVMYEVNRCRLFNQRN